MNNYKIIMAGKKYIYRGDHTDNAMIKFANRKVFGNPLVCNCRLKMYDADTRGVEWAQYVCDSKKVLIEKI